MSSTSIATGATMLESLSESGQDQVVEYLRDFLVEVQDGMIWDAQFERTQAQLIAAERRARQQIAEGLAQSLGDSQL